MCITFIPFHERPENISCDNTQMLLVSEDTGVVRLVGLLPVKSKSPLGSESTPTLLFFPVPSTFTPHIKPMANRLFCQSLRLEKLQNPETYLKKQKTMVKTRGISLPPNNQERVRIVENDDGSLVITLKTENKSNINMGELVLDKLLETRIDPQRVFVDMNTGVDLLNAQINGHIADHHDLIMCVPPFENNKPVLDGRGFSIQFVWEKNEFQGDIPLLGLCHNHDHHATIVDENYLFMTNMSFERLVFTPKNVPIQTDFYLCLFDYPKFATKYQATQQSLQKVAADDDRPDVYAFQEKTLRGIHNDIKRATDYNNTGLFLDDIKVSNLKGLGVTGSTRALLLLNNAGS